MDRYLVVSGLAGLGDRLETLGTAVTICRDTGRKLLIDWSDPEWNHEWPPKGFFHYISPKENLIPLLAATSDEETIRIMTDLQGFDVAPHAFRDRLVRPGVGPDRNRRILMTGGRPAEMSLKSILFARERTVVLAAYNLGGLQHVLPYIAFGNPPETTYEIGIHFRNTDRRHDVMDVTRRARMLWKPGMKVYLATDDHDSVGLFGEVFGENLHCDVPPRNKDGLHHMTKEQLGEIGLTKEDMNRKVIRDMLILSRCDFFVDSRRSLMSKVIRMLRKIKLETD